MKTALKIISLIASLACTSSLAEVYVDPIFQSTSNTQITVPPGDLKIIPLGNINAGDQTAVKVIAHNKVYNDITTCIATEQEVRTYSNSRLCRGHVRAKTPHVIKTSATEQGNHFVILDNTYAGLIQKNLTVQSITRKSLSDEEVGKIRSFFEGAQNQITENFNDSELDIHIKPCGQSNAFSNRATADITLCSELIHDMMLAKNPGALVSVLLHEYGHSLLNRWGEPGASEEDMADQFAVAIMLKGGDSGRRLLQGWIHYWTTRDSKAEALHQLTHGDTHTLSIQRARNIQNIINYPHDFSRRWNKMLYRHMKREALEKVIVKPTSTDDLDLAREALRLK